MKKSVKCKASSPIALATAITLASTGLFAGAAQAAPQSNNTHFVTDSIEIPMRSNPGYKFKIIRMLRSGTPVRILEVNEKGWAKLQYRTKTKTVTGWMPSSMLQSQPISRIQLKNQVKKTTKVEKALNQANLEKETLQTRYTNVSDELKQVKQDNFELNKKLEELQAISGNAIKLNEDNRRMSQDIERLNSENAIMKEQIDQAEDVVQRQWFLTGGGVLLLGLLLGRFFRVPSRRDKWNTLK